MKTIAIYNRKGGVGKSTIAASVGVAAFQDGLSVALLDADPQGSLAAWGDLRSRLQAGLPTVKATTLFRLEDALSSARRAEHALAIVDLPGSSGAGEIRALAAVDLVVVPSRASSFDYAATVATIDIIRAQRARAAIVLSQVRGRGGRTDDAREALAKLAPVIETDIGERVAFADAVASGQGITEFDPMSAGANEIRAVLAAIRSMLDAT